VGGAQQESKKWQGRWVVGMKVIEIEVIRDAVLSLFLVVLEYHLVDAAFVGPT
jgi:hypothetical protein